MFYLKKIILLTFIFLIFITPSKGQVSSIQFDTPSDPIPGLVGARDVAITPNRVFVLNGTQSEIVILNHQLQILCQFGNQGNGPGEYKEIFSIASNSEDLFVFDPVDRVIGKFDVSESRKKCASHIRDTKIQEADQPFLVFDATIHNDQLVVAGVSSNTRRNLTAGSNSATVQVLDFSTLKLVSEFGKYPPDLVDAFENQTVAGGMITENRFVLTPNGKTITYFSTSNKFYEYDSNNRFTRSIQINPSFYEPPKHTLNHRDAMNDRESWNKWLANFTFVREAAFTQGRLFIEYSRTNYNTNTESRYLAVYNLANEAVESEFSYDSSYSLEGVLESGRLLFSYNGKDGTSLLPVPIHTFDVSP